LLDSDVAVIDSENLSAQMRQIMLGAAKVFVSSASIWEIAIKARLGKLEGDPNEFAEAIGQSGFQEIAITARHAAKVYDLPLYHRDPFDRLLIAQAISDCNGTRSYCCWRLCQFKYDRLHYEYPQIASTLFG
jgi:PIN domain nuclease of toxin-antitoxin system